MRECVGCICNIIQRAGFEMLLLDTMLSFQPDGFPAGIVRLLGTTAAIYFAQVVFLRVYFAKRMQAISALKKVRKLKNTNDFERLELLNQLEAYLETIVVLNQKPQQFKLDFVMSRVPQQFHHYFEDVDVAYALAFSVTRLAAIFAVPKSCLLVMPLYVVFPFDRVVFSKGSSCIRNRLIALVELKLLDRLLGETCAYDKYVTEGRARSIRRSASDGNALPVRYRSVGRNEDLCGIRFAGDILHK